MKTIYKYQIPLDTDAPILDLPDGAQILHVDTQTGEDLCLWALVDPSLDSCTRRFLHIVGTGQPVPQVKYGLAHLGTALMMGGRLVIHVFEHVCNET